jgi:hypothetical protein
MQVRWVTAFIDMPASVFDAGAAFWCAVTGSTRSSLRGADGRFATLVPPDGDPYLRVQRTAEDGARIHVDLHVDDVVGAHRDAAARGAVTLHHDGHAIMASPAGFVFCLVEHRGETARPAPVADPAPHRVDQVCIDVPAPAFEAEVGFWSALTGWRDEGSPLPEYRPLARPAAMPLRLLLQRLGPDDDTSTARAHLDLACGPHADEVAAAHVPLGAREVGRWPWWTTMRDPAGLPYCCTGRDPFTGVRAR